jgi:hypothetical protein
MAKQMFDLLGPEHLDLATMCSADAQRYALTGLLLEPGRAAASNGRVLMAVPTKQVPEDELVEGLVPKGATPVTGKVSIDPMGLKKALTFAAKNGAVPELRSAVASFDPADAKQEDDAKPGDPPVQKRVTLAATDIETSGVAKARTIEGAIPDIDRVIPKPKKPVTVVLDTQLLKLAVAYVEKHGKEEHGTAFTTVPLALTIDAADPDHQAVVGTFTLADGERKGLLVLAPIRQKD